LAFSACGTCVSTRYGRIPRFSRAPGIVLTPHTGGPSPFGEVLTITVLPSLSRLGHGDGRARIVRMRHFAGRRWNINQLPIRWIRLRATLGPANPRLTSIVEEPLPQSAVWILTTLCCYSFHDSRHNAVHWTSRPSFHPRSAPSYPITLRCGIVSVVRLSPVHFRGPRPRPVICYELFER
jgi:hypothetical protein